MPYSNNYQYPTGSLAAVHTNYPLTNGLTQVTLWTPAASMAVLINRMEMSCDADATLTILVGLETVWGPHLIAGGGFVTIGTPGIGTEKIFDPPLLGNIDEGVQISIFGSVTEGCVSLQGYDVPGILS